MSEHYSIIVITHDKDLAIPVQQSLKPLHSEIFYAPNYPSFSKVVNEAIVSAKTEIVIIASYKTRPKPTDVERMLSLLEEGYGCVGLYRFGFFGFRKDLIRQIGFFDERFIKGGYEDCDFVRRIAEANIAFFDDESVEYIPNTSTWNYDLSRIFFKQKWTETTEDGQIWSIANSENAKIYRNLEEERYDYDLGTTKGPFIPRYLGREYTKSFSEGTQVFLKTITFMSNVEEKGNY